MPIIKKKRCPGCDQVLSIDHFSIHRCQKDGLRSHCKNCERQYIKNYTNKLRNRKNFKITIKEKQCPYCDKIKPICEFRKQKSNKDGLSAYCKQCNSKRFQNMASSPPSDPTRDMIHTYPEISNQWDYKKNKDKKPQNYTHLSKEHIWWICDTNDSHRWLSSIDQRTIQNKGCPFCANKKVCDSNCLATMFPDIADEWHPTKNDKLTPFDIVPCSHKHIWWQCKSNPDHIWKSIAKNRITNRTGCPFCRSLKSKGESKIAKFLDNKAINYQRQQRLSSCRNKNPLPFDFALLNKNNLIGFIEFHGIQHYKPISFGSKKLDSKQNLKNVQHHDKIKRNYCNNNNIPLLEIPYWDFNKIDNIINQFLLKILK